MYTTKAEDRRLTNEVLSWSLKGKLFQSESTAIEELYNFRFGTPIVAEGVHEHFLPFGEITRVNNKLIYVGNEHDQLRHGKQAVEVPLVSSDSQVHLL